MKNHPPYATEAGTKRVDVAARAICQARNHPGCKGICARGCTGTDEDLELNGTLDDACAALLAIDRYDDDQARTPYPLGGYSL